MKRLHLYIFLIAICFLVSACENDDIEITVQQGVSTPKPVVKKEEPKTETLKDENTVKEEPKEVNIDDQYPLKDVVVTDEKRKEILEQLPKINSYDVNESIRITKSIRDSEVGQRVLMDILTDKNSKLRRHASAILASFCQKNYIPYLRRFIAAEEQDPVVLNNLLQALGSWTMNPVGLTFIYDIFKTTDSVYMKKSIAHFLSQLNTAPGVFLLIEKVKDGNAEVRQECVRSLGRIGWSKDNPQSYKAALLEAIVDAMHNDPVEEVRNEALQALIAIQNTEVSPYLVEFFMNKDNYYEYRVKAIERISRLADNRFNDAIEAQLDDPNWKIRYQSLSSLGILSAEKALPKILELYHNDKINLVRLQAMIAATKFKDERVKKILLDNMDNPDKLYAVPAIVHIIYQDDTSVLPILVKKFDHEDMEIRLYAYLSVSIVSHNLKIGTYLDDYKRRLKVEDEEDLKELLTQIVESLSNVIAEGTQTQENKEDGQQTKENDKADNKDE